MSKGEWDAAIGSFVGDLRIPMSNLLNPGILAEAYDQTVGALLEIAQSIGFEPGWRFGTQR